MRGAGCVRRPMVEHQTTDPPRYSAVVRHPEFARAKSCASASRRFAKARSCDDRRGSRRHWVLGQSASICHGDVRVIVPNARDCTGATVHRSGDVRQEGLRRLHARRPRRANIAWMRGRSRSPPREGRRQSAVVEHGRRMLGELSRGGQVLARVPGLQRGAE